MIIFFLDFTDNSILFLKDNHKSRNKQGVIMKETIYEKKEELRKNILQKRQKLTADFLTKNSQKIIAQVLDLPEYQESQVVASYVNIKGEVMTRNFINKSLQAGKKVVVPIILDIQGQKNIALSQIFSPEEDLAERTMGILEPKPDKIRIIVPEEVDFLLIPGLAFDYHGNRLGFGAGYYDRLLLKIRNDSYTAAIAFDFQLFNNIPTDDQDQQIKYLITEKRKLIF